MEPPAKEVPEDYLFIDLDLDESAKDLVQDVNSTAQSHVAEQSLTEENQPHDNKACRGIENFTETEPTLEERESAELIINVLLPKQSNLVVKSDKNMKVDDFKRLIIQQTEGKYANFQLLYNHYILDEGKHLSDYGINSDDQILLASHLPSATEQPVLETPAKPQRHQNESILVHFISDKFDLISLVCDPNSSLMAIRIQLEEHIGSYSQDVSFTYDGRTLDDELTLFQARVMDGCSIYLSLPNVTSTHKITANNITVNCKYENGQRFSIQNLTTATSIDEIKKYIGRHMNVRPKKIQIKYQNRVLEDNTTLQNCGYDDANFLDVVICDAHNVFKLNWAKLKIK